jgi:hypothetical protein
MPRLPVPDQDANQWGALLNDFLRVGHLEDGSSRGVFDVINVRDFGTKGDGKEDDTKAVQDAFNAVTDHGGIVYFPTGNYYITGPLHIKKHRTHILGAGIYAATIIFNPASSSPLFDLNASPGVLYQCSIRNLGLLGMGEQQKIAIRATDTSELIVENIAVFVSWQGNTSIGLQLRGRDLGTIRKVNIFADRPISIEENPNSKDIALDHYHFEDLYLAPQMPTESCIHIAPQINLTNITLDGTNAFVLGKHGIYWDDPNPPTATSLYLNFQNIRREQSQDPNGYTIFINHYVQNVLLQNVSADTYAKGFFFRNVRYLTLQNCFYPGQPATTPQPEAFNADQTCWDIILQNCFFQVGSTVSIQGLEEVFSLQKYAGAFPATIYYDTSVNTNKNIKIYGANTFRHTGILAVGGIYAIPFHGTQKAAIVHIATYGEEGSINEGGIWLVTAQSVVLLTGTVNAAAVSSGGKLCVVYGSPVQVINNLSIAVTYVITVDWTA